MDFTFNGQSYNRILLPLSKADIVSMLLFPDVACHGGPLAKSMLMILATKNAHIVTSQLDSVTVHFASSACGAAKGTEELVGC